MGLAAEGYSTTTWNYGIDATQMRAPNCMTQYVICWLWMALSCARTRRSSSTTKTTCRASTPGFRLEASRRSEFVSLVPAWRCWTLHGRYMPRRPATFHPNRLRSRLGILFCSRTVTRGRYPQPGSWCLFLEASVALSYHASYLATAGEPWVELPWIKLLEYGPFFLLLGLNLLKWALPWIPKGSGRS